MKKRIIEKLKNRKGESIGEVLVALLISSLALVMLASMITSSSNMIQTSRIKIKEYYEANNALETRDVTVSELTGSVKIDNSNTKLMITDGDNIPVKYFKNEVAPSGTQVVSFKIKINE